MQLCDEKSPKRFRFTLVWRMQNYALDVIENLYIANEIYVQAGRRDRAEKRQAYQQKAQTGLRLLGYIAQLAMEQQCILPKQYEQITRKGYDCRNLLGAWMVSDRKRFGL
jgi:hypothetical protein